MFVIYGMPRSGTTLLAQCVSAHSQLVIPDETDFIVPAAHAMSLIDDPAAGRRVLTDLIVGTDRFEATIGRYLTAEEVHGAVHGAPYRLDAVVDSVFAALATSAGVGAAGDKSPNDLMQIKPLVAAGLFTDRIRVLHRVRDPRDIIVSMARLGWLTGLDANVARQWRNVNTALREAHRDDPGRYHLVRYEDLVVNPEATLAAVCAHLAVDYEAEMIGDEARYAQFPDHKGMAQHANTYRPIDLTSVGRWTTHLDGATRARVAEIAGEALATFGYEVEEVRR